jgi:hypothetical protein
VDVFDADILVAPMTQASENLYLHGIRFHQTSRADPKAEIRRSVANALSSLERIDMAAVCRRLLSGV